MPFLVLEIADFICVERDSVESKIILKSLCSSSFFTCRGEKLVKITSTSFFTLAFAKFANFVWISQMTTMFITRGGGLLDLILDGDVQSRFQKHTRSLYQFFQNVYPTLCQFFKNRYPTLYQFSENAYPILYQLQKLRKSIPFLIPKS